LLASHGLHWTDTQIAALSEQIVTRTLADNERVPLREALRTLRQESETVLGRFGLTFIQSLTTEMDAIDGWETTAEFLEIANEKSNAELRIAAASALLALLDYEDTQYHDDLHYLAAHPELDDVNAVIATRVLAWLGKTT